MQVFIADYFFKSNLAEDFSLADIQVNTCQFKTNFQIFGVMKI